jgi:hypothetical protein
VWFLDKAAAASLEANNGDASYDEHDDYRLWRSKKVVVCRGWVEPCE